MTIALARRYRPKRFADLLVQDHVAAVLRGAVARGRVGHGYLLTGPRGVGKTTAARILAMALNCPNRDAAGDPCGECENCLRVWNGSANLDVVEIDAASNRGVDDARDLRERAMYAASREGHYKVYIVDEAHMLTREAWNALLKVLEEPPPGVVFVFATTEPQKIAAAAAPVLSRLQRFDFRRIGPGGHPGPAAAGARGRGDRGGRRRAHAHRPARRRRHARRAQRARPVPELRRRAPSPPQRVREVLGLVGDELYAEVLDLVADATPRGRLSAGRPAGRRRRRSGRVHGRRGRGAPGAAHAAARQRAGGTHRGPAQRARVAPGPARAGRRAPHAAAAGRQRDRHPPEREPPADRRDAAAPVDDARPDRGSGARCSAADGRDSAGGRGRRRRRAGPAAVRQRRIARGARHRRRPGSVPCRLRRSPAAAASPLAGAAEPIARDPGRAPGRLARDRGRRAGPEPLPGRGPVATRHRRRSSCPG